MLREYWRRTIIIMHFVEVVARFDLDVALSEIDDEDRRKEERNDIIQLSWDRI